MSMLKRVTIYLDPDIHKALKLKSAETLRPVSAMVAESVKYYLNNNTQEAQVNSDRVKEATLNYDEKVTNVKLQTSKHQGIMIPKSLVEQAKLGNEVDIEVSEKLITIRSVKRAREGWEEQFKLMAQRGDDYLLDPESSTNRWDEKEWEW
jgi:antitoxin MazE